MTDVEVRRVRYHIFFGYVLNCISSGVIYFSGLVWPISWTLPLTQSWHSLSALRYSPEIQQALMLGMVAALMLGENYSPGLEIPRSPLLSKMAQRNDWDYPDGKDTLPQL